MVATRSARKRASGELSRTSILSLSSSGGVKTRNHNQQHSSGTSTSSSCNTRNNSDELSSQPKIKRQKTTASQKSKKARALKPVPANVKKQQPGAGSSKTARSSRAKKIIAPVATTTTKPTKFEASTTAASASAATTKSKSSTNKKRETKKATSKRKSSSSSNSKNEQQRKKQQLRNKNNASSSSSTTTDVETTATIAGADEPQQRTKFLRSASTRSSRSSSSSTSAAASLSLLSRSSSTKKGSTRNITGAEDIDAKDRNDPTYVTDYVDDMYEHYRYKEETTTVDRMYMGSTTDKGKTGGGGGGGKKKQPHINETMRCILVDWLVEVHYKFKLFPETLYLTVNLLDRFLSKSKESITKRDLQLVGVTALLISSKYEEMYIPELRDLTYICDGAYTEAKVRTVMKLTWNLRLQHACTNEECLMNWIKSIISLQLNIISSLFVLFSFSLSCIILTVHFSDMKNNNVIFRSYAWKKRY